MSPVNKLLRAAMTSAHLHSLPASQTAAETQHGEHVLAASQENVLMPTATVLAHMLEMCIACNSKQSTPHKGKQQSKSADSACQLGVILSLVLFVGGLSCPIHGDDGKLSPAKDVAAAAGSAVENALEGSPSSISRQEPQAQAPPGSDTVDNLPTAEGFSSDPDMAPGQTPTQSAGSAQPQQAPAAAVPQEQCQELCLQVLRPGQTPLLAVCCVFNTWLETRSFTPFTYCLLQECFYISMSMHKPASLPTKKPQIGC